MFLCVYTDCGLVSLARLRPVRGRQIRIKYVISLTGLAEAFRHSWYQSKKISGMADRRDWGGGGDDPEESTQRMIERIWESLTDIRARMDQQAPVPPVAVPPGDGEAVPVAPIPPRVERSTPAARKRPGYGYHPSPGGGIKSDRREPAVIPSDPFEPSPPLVSDPTPECPPPAMTPTRREQIDHILDEQVVTTQSGDCQRYLVRWKGRPSINDAWITRSELQQIDPDLLERHQSRQDPYSTGSSSSQTGGIGGDTRALDWADRVQIYRRRRRRATTTASIWLDDWPSATSLFLL
ncbi:hypothetical protein Taro_030085 [Colocasia esculenta]|uniref:Chromo domain-containing protein n=1 Tax=Colocasia esculenta TaxID=4460 RepID=A0A843VLJ3_COLES|nr:hypothetical protein [Colocasia esculenta]